MNKVLRSYSLQPFDGTVFDIPVHRSDLFLQSAVPGFEYPRCDINKNVRFLGALLPYKTEKPATVFVRQDKLKQYEKIILVTQGTVEKDIKKILIPTLEAFKDSPYLVVATTGGSQTKALQDLYPQENFIIEDFIDFNYIMPHADVFVSNGGYGGVMMGISHQLPLVVAGIHEGKNEVNARVGYFKLGINLKTENPSSERIRKSVEEVLENPGYKQNVRRLYEEFQQYNPATLCEYYIEELLHKHASAKKQLAS
jgi:UDP:flavonoid glycosyltransferase YjiC (YdhE family)